MFYLDTTNKFLAITVTNSGGFTDYSTRARSGHLYYKNDVSDPWGNNGVHIGSFDLKTAGTKTFVFGNSGILTGSLSNSAVSNKDKYVSMCNMFSAGNLDYHFLTIVVDRDKPGDYVYIGCPCSQTNPGGLNNTTYCAPNAFNFLGGYNYLGAKISITPYYINSNKSLIQGTTLTSASMSFWDQLEFGTLTTCQNLRANSATSGRFPDTANNINNISWTNGDVIIPTHDCAPDGPGATVWYGAYRYYRQGTANPAQCVSTIASYSLKNGQHTFGQVFQNPLGTFNSRIITTPTSTSSILNSESYSVGYTAYDQIFGSTNGAQGTGTVQCPITTGTPRGNVLGPRYMLDISLRCNPGARTNTMGPYYNGNTYPTYGGYGFYFKFIWDALCYPCV